MPHGFCCESGFIAQLVSRDGQLDGLPLQMPLDGPQQQQQAGDRKIRIALLGILVHQIFVVNDDRRADHQQGANVARLDELHAGANDDVGHRSYSAQL